MAEEKEKEKSTRWQFTAFESHYHLIEARHDVIAEIGWQDEICPDTGRKHRQGYLRTVRQVRKKQLYETLPGVHIEVARNWAGLVNYCRKQESRDPSGNQVALKYERPLRLHEMLIEAARNYLHEKETGMWSDPAYICLDRQTDRQILLKALACYSRPLVHAHPEYGVVLSRSDARDAWCNYIQVWVEKAEDQ